MSSFKRLKSSDVFVVPYVASKNWEFTVYSGSYYSEYATVYYGQTYTSSFNSEVTTSDGYYQHSIFESINHQFYQAYSGSTLVTQSLMLTATNYESASTQRPTSSYDDTYPEATKYLPYENGTSVLVLAIDKKIYGERIKPGSIHLVDGSSQVYGDDGKGNLINITLDTPVGNVFYSHGFIVFTNQDFSPFIQNLSVSFNNEYTIYENHISCTVEESEYNLTYNPSLRQNITGSVKDFATGSIFVPYVTTVGLYNDNNELLMVAKMAQPIPISSETDMTFLIKYDS